MCLIVSSNKSTSSFIVATKISNSGNSDFFILGVLGESFLNNNTLK